MTRRVFDWPLALSTLMLCGFGLLFLYSASHQASASSGVSYVARQALWMCIGFLIMVWVIRFPVTRWFDLAGPLYIFNIALLILVLWIGRSHFGAQRWLSLGPLAFQPSEICKLTVILLLARYLGLKTPHQKLPKTLFVSLALVAIPSVLILMQPDLGTSLTLVPVLFALLWVWGLPARWWWSLIGVQAALSPLLWLILKDYQKRRLLVFLDPNQDPLGAGYSIIQSKIAIGSGGLLGKGWLAGTQNRLNFLPEHHTDFIFSVVGEEWGFLGGAVILLLYWIIVWRGFAIASVESHQMSRLLAVGIGTLFAVHVFINIGMTMGLMPVVGLPLPFASYGRTFLLISLFAVSLLLALRWQRKAY